jgi:hypothetical protein
VTNHTWAKTLNLPLLALLSFVLLLPRQATANVVGCRGTSCTGGPCVNGTVVIGDGTNPPRQWNLQQLC